MIDFGGRPALTPEHHAALKAAHADPLHCLQLLQAGVDPDTVVNVVVSRAQTGWGDSLGDDDTRLFAATGDPVLLVRVAAADLDSGTVLSIINGDGPMTRAELDACLDAGVDVHFATAWTSTGRAVDDFIAAHAQLPDLPVGTLYSRMNAGATVSDLTWLLQLGVTPAHLDAMSGLDGLDGLEAVAGAYGPEVSAQARRLAMLLRAVSAFTLDAAATVSAAVGDAPWADTFARLVVDGTAPAVAVRVARADHELQTSLDARAVHVPAPADGRTGRTGRTQ